VDLLVTWKYYFEINYFIKLGLNQAVLEKNSPRYTSKLVKLKQSLGYCTVLTILGLLSFNLTGSRYIRNPYEEPLEKDLIISIGNWVGLMLCCILVLNLGGDPRKKKRNETQNGSRSVNSTNTDLSELDDSSALVTSASNMPTSASLFPPSASNVPNSSSLLRLPYSSSAQIPHTQTRLSNPSSRVPNSSSLIQPPT